MFCRQTQKGQFACARIYRGGGEAGTSVGGSLAASSSVGHAPSHIEAADSSRTHGIDSKRGRLLRDTIYRGKCGVKVSVAVASKLMQMTGSERFIFGSLFGRCCEVSPKQSW